MDTDACKAISRLLVDQLLHAGNVDLADQLVAEDFVEHIPISHQRPGRDGLIEALQTIRTGFPDARVETIVELEEADLHATVERFTGTHAGSFLGVPATNRSVSFLVARIARMRDGRMVESWRFADTRVLKLQLGVLPSLDDSGSFGPDIADS